ncbi:MAG: aminodeoxychorismate synthase component I, partial [bacterium]
GFPHLWFGVFPRSKKMLVEDKKFRSPPPAIEPEAEIDYDRYRRGFQRIKEQIKAGNTYQVNYTFKIKFQTELSNSDLFLRLRRHHPVPFAAFVNTGNYTISSHSPELFLRREDQKILARPMKGTACRGETVADDRENLSYLQNSSKEQAENLMIVDLLRNDLGRIGKVGTVEVPRLFEIERYETLHQMVSTVEAELEIDSPYEIFRALFPCGSITGAPKRRTMKIIEEVEASPRNIYTGSIGLFKPGGDFCFNIAIRTLLNKRKSSLVRLGTGGGVVVDGEARNEWEEAWLKTKFLSSRQPKFSLVETISYSPGKGMSLLARHLDRLKKSAECFSISLDRKEVRKLLVDRLRSCSKPVKVRLLVNRSGQLKIETSDLPLTPANPRVGIIRRELQSEEVPYLKHKTTFRPTYSELRSRAAEKNYFDYLLVDKGGYLTEGTISNIFIEKNNQLYTPPVERGLLPGIMREVMLEKGAVEADIHREELFEAESVYLTNAVRGKIKVEQLNISESVKTVCFD